MSSAPALRAARTCVFVGNAPPWVSRYAAMPRAAIPDVTGVAWEVPLKMSKAKLPSHQAGSSNPVPGFVQYRFRGAASTAKDPMLTTSGFGCPRRVGPRLEKYAWSPYGPGPSPEAAPIPTHVAGSIGGGPGQSGNS